MATGSRSSKGKKKMVMGTETQDQCRKLQEEMRHFDQLAGYESVQSQDDVEVDGDATQPNTEHQVEPQQPNSQPIGHTTGPQPTRPPLHPNGDETGEFKTMCGVCKTKYEIYTGWGTGAMARHLETHGILTDSGISLNQAQIFGSLQPAYCPVSQGALKKRINSCFTNTYTELLNYLTAFKGRVSVTCDLWRSPFQENFLGVTCHWIDEKWNMQKRIIGFEVIEIEKNGYLLKNALMTVFTNFGIQNKILSLGVDNASSNTKCIDYMFESRCLDFLIKDFFHVRCVCHVLNLCVQDDVPYNVSRIMNDSNNLLQFLYDKYSEDAQPTTPQTPIQPMPSVPVSQFLYDTLVRGPGVSTTSGLQDESFDILLWWKENGEKYPILHRIAKDILTCPPSTVAIESAFSTERRILDDKRAALTPNTIKVLICLKDWQMMYN
ncbi:hypothetical protein Cgig2_000350 [Carnegiea gigantea]|uniref:HAT C-terminal dimerisation domain-containing protein n=1 Tax=Carnegiea gigantea TaxID=171969 RepID=A0A9Q1QGM2_9CARY|nr:hypothetical protein Cgig2_000350 [Carnegiea gigantea]